jgi:serine O-acetyltransferase
MFAVFRRDLERYAVEPSDRTWKGYAELWFYNEELWFLAAYRLARWVRASVRVPVVRQVACVVTRVLHRFLSLVTGIQIDIETEVGPGLYIGHGGKLVVNPKSQIGACCNLSTGVVVGEAGRGERRGVPSIGDRVYVAPGAKILGKIRIGNDVAIGANAVVTKDVPDNAVVVGIPAQVISLAGSGDFIQTPHR